MSAHAVPTLSLNDVWKSYYEQVELLNIYAADRKTVGALVNQIDLVKAKTKNLIQNPLVFREEFGHFTEAKMHVLAAAQVANERGLEIIEQLHKAFAASLPPDQTRQFPFVKQEAKLRDLIEKVEAQRSLLEASLLEAFHQEELANQIEKKAIPPLENKKIS